MVSCRLLLRVYATTDHRAGPCPEARGLGAGTGVRDRLARRRPGEDPAGDGGWGAAGWRLFWPMTGAIFSCKAVQPSAAAANRPVRECGMWQLAPSWVLGDEVPFAVLSLYRHGPAKPGCAVI